MANSKTIRSRSIPLVLIADDTVPTTMMLQRVFESEGYEVYCVHDGISALDFAKNLLPDLILLDINMPEMSGFEVLSQLRKDPSTANIPTILITAMGDLSDIVQGLQLGADDYVRKPFHWRELLARAQSKMRARKLEEALQRRTEELEALLVVSEELNQHLEADEILELILRLSLELVGGEIAVIYQLDAPEIHPRILKQNGTRDLQEIDHRTIIKAITQKNEAFIWDEADSLSAQYPHGLVSPVKYDEHQHLQFVLTLFSNAPYDNNHLQLIAGISRQANMALHNAELYRIKANYATHLEERVEERTHELRSAQQMLIRSEKLASVGRLAASIAHEINNPLLPIQINLDDMLEDLRDQHPINPEEIIRTQESVERIRRIVNRLLEFTGNAHMTTTTGQYFDLNKLITNVCDLVRKSFEQQGQIIEVELGSIPLLYADKDGIEQVFMNLTLNASEAMERGGKVKITTLADDENIIVKVEDNGCGVPSEFIDKMFEPFVSTKDDGNGLGLFITYGIIQSHNGSLEVDSVVGKSTTFTVKLPISHPEAAHKLR